ncbi:unnamed protein product [Moneuplotes crassus]|uniref:Uncharacterized protein n=1 Tax=Euplotes crassus TaxID=5936 RepID=A0AAD1U7L2_EUPCR|nr:unnamed protein product [Moneuplotes crassus]
MIIKSAESEVDPKECEGEADQEAQETPPEPEVNKKQEGEGEGEGYEEKEQKDVPNPYLENVNKIPPLDPDVNNILEEDLVTKHLEIKSLVEHFSTKMFAWISENKKDMLNKIVFENREILLENKDDLDEKLKFQLPRKGKLEVEVYQERKSQITAHNKKYERQIRSCLECHNNAEKCYDKQQDMVKGNIPNCKNLAELQGTSRCERDSFLAHADNDIKLNNNMLKSCVLFNKGGNYSELEIKLYEAQMEEINEMLKTFKDKKEKELEEIKGKLQQRLSETYEEFEGEYKSGVPNLVAKEGLGQKFGAPRRIIQEKMRAEMAKCECIVHYAKHLKSANENINDTKDFEDVADITLDENHATIDITEEEQSTLENRKESKLQHLGIIGTTKEDIKTFGQSVKEIKTIAIENCQKLYEGEDAQWLIGDKRELSSCRISSEIYQVLKRRLLRVHQIICEDSHGYILVYRSEIYKQDHFFDQNIEREYIIYEKSDKELRAKHLLRFRPDLANPVNAQKLDYQNSEAKERTEKCMDTVDDTQVKLVDLEIDLSNEFYIAYLNNLRALLKLHIELPQEEVVVKKKLNIKVLTAKYQGKDLLTQPTRKWEGLGLNPFKVDLTKYDTFYDYENPD